MFNFIEYYLDYNNEAESPEEFWRWSAITCLAAALRNNVYLDWHQGTVYPNIYTILYAESGNVRKAAPCKFAGKLLREAGVTKFIAGRASVQAVVKELGMSYSNERGVFIGGAAALLYSEELSSFLVKDPSSIDLLIDLADFHAEWSNNLISGTTHLKNVCLSMLAASNSELFKSVYTEQAVKGGLLGRTFVIHQEKARHRKSLLDLEVNAKEPQPLVNHLLKLSKIKGVLRYSEEAKREYNRWYYEMPEEIYIDKIGYGARLGTHALKIAIALAAAKEEINDLTLQKDDIEQAIDLVTGIRKTYRHLTVGVGGAVNSKQHAMVVKAIIAAKGKIPRKQLVRNLFGEVSIDELDKIIQMLVQGDLVLEGIVGKEVGYSFTTKGIDIFMLGLDSD